MAESILTYTRVRHRMTLESAAMIVDLVRSALGENLRVAAITSFLEYDWTGGVFARQFLGENPFDEIWVDPSNEFEFDVAEPRPLRYYMATRSRYYFDGMIGILSQIQQGKNTSLSKMTPTRVYDLAWARVQNFLSRLSSPFALSLMEDNSLGFVLPGFVPADAQPLLEHYVPKPEQPDASELLETLLHTVQGAGESA